ncbi:ATP phosphoribosyltransferase regulatory subunit [Shouchella patagoniensis]|uniref:ATP phosphoribosyltransferase regulatory subunit n=1 Tax=Shouchella patagoniensis TaxID=228576 RepID=UPI0015D60DE2|nr:ATP phosphoribosyltransferase regulatory subunit [Shouchella patagoniensis]
MSEPFMFEKPLGMRDVLPARFRMQKRIAEWIQTELEAWGYEQVQTPALEYYETVGKSSAISDKQLFKLIDLHGNTLVLRPDMTAPIARLASSSMKQVPYPLRLSYHSSLYRAQQVEGGRPAEFEQIGVELIGDDTASADGEMLILFNQVLYKAGLNDFQIAIGHIGFLNALFIEVLGTEKKAVALRQQLFEKNDVGFREQVSLFNLSPNEEKKLLKLSLLRGGKEVLEEAEELVDSTAGKQAINELRDLAQLLEDDQLSSHVKFDLSLVLHMDYYTGCVFETYHNRLAQPLGGGGRYDALLEKFGRPGPATGFGLRLDLLTEAIEKREGLEKRSCVLYSKERRKEAYQLADALRNEGKKVVIQDLKGIQNEDVIASVYEDMHYVVGKTSGGQDE